MESVCKEKSAKPMSPAICKCFLSPSCRLANVGQVVENTCMFFTLVQTTTIGKPRLSVKTFGSNGKTTSSSSLPIFRFSSPCSGSTYSWNCLVTRNTHSPLFHLIIQKCTKA